MRVKIVFCARTKISGIESSKLSGFYYVTPYRESFPKSTYREYVQAIIRFGRVLDCAKVKRVLK